MALLTKQSFQKRTQLQRLLKMFVVLVLLVVVARFYMSWRSDESTATRVAKSYAAKIYTANSDETKDLVTGDFKTSVSKEMFANGQEPSDIKDTAVSVNAVDVTDDAAGVVGRITGADNFAATFVQRLVKQDGNWKVESFNIVADK